MVTESTHGLWGDLHRFDLSPEQTDFSILGIPYDGAVCARTGARLGPERTRHWSQHLTPFSEDRTRLGAMRIGDLGDIQIAQQEQDFELVRRKVATLPNIPILLGGDHSVTIPIFQGQRERFAGKRLGVLWVDAHPDLCYVFTGSKYSHAFVLRRGLECGIKPEDVCLVGLRSWSAFWPRAPVLAVPRGALLDQEADLALLRLRRRHQLADGVEDNLELGIVFYL